jgi:ABC-type transport system substrate-binding protein
MQYFNRFYVYLHKAARRQEETTMKIGPLLIFMVLIISVILVVGCGPAGNSTPALTASLYNHPSTIPIQTPPFPPIPLLLTPLTSPQPGSIVGSPFLPGEVLATLPVYPGKDTQTIQSLVNLINSLPVAPDTLENWTDRSFSPDAFQSDISFDLRGRYHDH